MDYFPTKNNRRVLVIDDNRAIHDDFRKILSPEMTTAAAAVEATEAELFGNRVEAVRQLQCVVDSAYQGMEGVAMVQKALDEDSRYAMAFVDVRMPPGCDGVETTQKIWAIDPDIQIVLCTAYSDYSWDEMFDKIGNCDGLVILKKPFDTVEALQLTHALTEKWWLGQQSKKKMKELESIVAQRTGELQMLNHSLQKEVAEHTASEENLRGKTAFLEAQLNASIDGILVVNNSGKKTLQNQRLVELFKIPPHVVNDPEEDPQRRWLIEVIKKPDQFLEKITYLDSHPGEISRDELQLKDGTILDRYSSPVIGDHGLNYGRIWTFRDITARRLLESRLFQSQKLETVGKLAGGIAHEFNSILTAIIGQCELMLRDLPVESPSAKSASEISLAATRAAGLTRQLLAYGRKQILQPEILDLNQVLRSMEGVLRHIMGGDIETRVAPFLPLKMVKADAGQIEQVILNMATNARDAMPNGGKFTLETANVSFDEESVARYPELKAGDYVMLAIADTGAGMTEEVKARIFEPFFSTKGVGEGTGLGLSTCYGIIKQSGGHISLYTEAGRGSTFKIYLPQAEPLPYVAVERVASHDLPGGTETILLVEDDPALREMAGLLLKRLGYTVWAAANGVEALSLKQQRGVGHIDLLFTDVVMPHMSGKELADRVRSLYPHTRILFTSAYTENAIIHQGVLDKGVALLQKPFTPSALAHKLRQVLEAPAKESQPQT